jgi:uncharacterized protein YggE
VRLVALALAGAALALASTAPLAAQSRGAIAPLADGEVLVEVNGVGIVTTRGDRATLSFGITGGGETDAAARADAERNAGEVRARLRALGVADADIRIEPVAGFPGNDMERAMAAAQAAMEEAAAEAGRQTGAPEPQRQAAPASHAASAAAEVVIRNMAVVPAVQALLDERHLQTMQGPVYTLNDDSAQRRGARLQAMEKVRADAETYAVALNMRVVRVVRVTERLGMDAMSMAFQERLMGSIFNPATGRGTRPEVATVVLVGVDYVLAPR